MTLIPEKTADPSTSLGMTTKKLWSSGDGWLEWGTPSSHPSRKKSAGRMGHPESLSRAPYAP